MGPQIKILTKILENSSSIDVNVNLQNVDIFKQTRVLGRMSPWFDLLKSLYYTYLSLAYAYLEVGHLSCSLLEDRTLVTPPFLLVCYRTHNVPHH